MVIWQTHTWQQALTWNEGRHRNMSSAIFSYLTCSQKCSWCRNSNSKLEQKKKSKGDEKREAWTDVCQRIQMFPRRPVNWSWEIKLMGHHQTEAPSKTTLMNKQYWCPWVVMGRYRRCSNRFQLGWGTETSTRSGFHRSDGSECDSITGCDVYSHAHTHTWITCLKSGSQVSQISIFQRSGGGDWLSSGQDSGQIPLLLGHDSLHSI